MDGDSVWLALLQGLTEFLPISSSGHLLLLETWFGRETQDMALDVAVHLGTLVAVLVYFRRDLVAMGRSGFSPGALSRQRPSLLWLLALGTVPLVVVGGLGRDWIAVHLRHPDVVAWATLGFGVLLGLADVWGRGQRTEASLGWRDALVVGLFQVLAFIPGTSRSGITLTAGLLLGLDRTTAARFAFLLAIPAIAAAGGLELLTLWQAATPVPWGTLLLSAALAGAVALLTIHAFLRWVERVGMLPFAVYRVMLGGLLLVWGL